MNFINKLKLLFFNETQVGIINLGDIIQIPGRDYYNGDIEKINLIDSYKEQYLQLLSQKRTITTRELKFDNLQEDMIMNVDLLLHSIISDDSFLNLSSEELMIQMAKLQIYLFEINKMEVETITRLIALKELEKGKRVLRRNKNCLTDEINNLSNSLVIFLGQKNAIQKEIDSYLRTISINKNDHDEESINQRYNLLLYISEDIIPRNSIELINDLIARIAYMERELEIYTYRNKSEINSLNRRLIELKVHKSFKSELLEEITYLEKKYLIFYKYGNNIVQDEKLRLLYEKKFDILTCDIDERTKSPIKKDDYGYSYYSEIISEKLENIILGKNEIFNATFKDKYIEAIELIKELINNNFNGYDDDNILNSILELNIILSFDYKSGFQNMLNNKMITSKSRYPHCIAEKSVFEGFFDNKHSGIKWEDEVPLKSILFFVNENYGKEIYNHIIYKLFKLIDISNETYFNIPEGIKEIYGDKSYPLTNQIIVDSEDKVVILPSTLKHLSISFSHGIRGIQLNNGIEYLGKRSLYYLYDTKIEIPSSIKKIDKDALCHGRIMTIIFDDYENSHILYDKKALCEMLENLFYLEKGNRYHQPPSKEILKTQEAYLSERTSFFGTSFLFDHGSCRNEIIIKPRFFEIVLKDNSKNIVCKLFDRELEGYDYVITDYYEDFELESSIPTPRQIEIVVNKILKIISDKMNINPDIFEEIKKELSLTKHNTFKK